MADPVAPDAILGVGGSADNARTRETSLEQHGAAESMAGSNPRYTGQSGHVGGAGDSPVRGTLVARPSRGAALIQRIDDRIRRKAERVVAANGDAASIDDSGRALEGVPADENGRPRGWTAVRHQIAKDSRQPLKTQPGYISQQLRIFESYKKAPDAGSGPSINAQYVQINVTQTNVYPVRKVRDD